jgi:hypothetical protein
MTQAGHTQLEEENGVCPLGGLLQTQAVTCSVAYTSAHSPCWQFCHSFWSFPGLPLLTVILSYLPH